jgi:hypothetical protein
MKHKTVRGHKGGQTVDEQSSIEVDVIVEHLGLKEKGKAGGASQGIENANLLRKHRGIVGRHIGGHNVQRLRSIGKGLVCQVNPMRLEGGDNGLLILVHREHALGRREVCQRRQFGSRDDGVDVHVVPIEIRDLRCCEIEGDCGCEDRAR